MPRNKSRKASSDEELADRLSTAPSDELEAEQEEQAAGSGPSPTAVAAEAMRTGVMPLQSPQPQEEGPQIPREDDTLRMGDPDVSPITSAYVGDETVGGSMATPDQNRVDAIGRAYGVAEEDTGSLRTSSELLDRRDRQRSQQEEPEPNE